MLHQQDPTISDFSETAPLTWWRVAPPDALSIRDANRVGRALRGLSIFGEPAWKDAVDGAAAAAIGIAIRAHARHACIEEVIDLAMSPVLIAAIKGDAAARLFISHMLAKRTAVDDAASQLANSWLRVNSIDAHAPRREKLAPRMRLPRRRAVMSCGHR